MSADTLPINTNENLYVDSTKERAAKEAATNENDKVSQDQFLQLLIAQMTHQDPLNPMDNSEFMSQMAQLQALDEQIETNGTLQQMNRSNQLAAAATLIGTQVRGLTEGDVSVTGIVGRALVQEDKLYVVLTDGQKLPLANVEQVDPLLAGE
jgi:flagellar basal-body rod modification protein FlgD